MTDATPPRTTGDRAVTLRAALLTLLLGALCYVAVIGAVLITRIGPAAGKVQHRSRGVLEEYRASDQRAYALDSVAQQIGLMLDSAHAGHWPATDPAPIRLTLQDMQENARTLERLGPSEGAQDSLLHVLASGVQVEAMFRAVLLATTAAIELHDVAGADSVYSRVSSLQLQVRSVLSRATSVALDDVNRAQDDLVSVATLTTRFVIFWLLVGALAFPLLIFFLRRRLYVPLAQLDHGLARIAAGHLDVALSAPVNDELGRVNEHFNRMTAMLRQRASEEAERSALESAVRTRAILEAALDAVVVIDKDGAIREWNHQAEQVFAWKRAEVLGRPVAEVIVPPELRGPHPSEMWSLATGGPARMVGRRIETFALRRDGTRIPVEIATTELNQGGRLEYSAFVRDLTVQRRLEQEVRQSQKMEAVGRLAGGIAHDFNNLLTVIIGRADLLRSESRISDTIRDDAEGILAAAERGAALSRKMLTLAQRSPGRHVPVDLSQIVGEVSDLFLRTIDRRIEVIIDLTVEGSVVHGDPSELSNALLNLALNARDAMPEGGKLVITTEFVTLSRAFVAGHYEGEAASEYVAITVRDTGTGMTEETKARAFEPFFTTKPPGAGTGLGLAMVYGTVRSHRGIVTVDSAAGAGCTFTIFLPVNRDPTVPGDSPRDELQTGRGRILVADDEAEIRTTATRILERLGYRVDTAIDGLDAVEQVRDATHPWDLIILDSNMPRLTGQDAARQIRAISPDVPLVLSSGYLDATPGAAAELTLFHGMIGKPYDIAGLSRTVAEVLAKRDATP